MESYPTAWSSILFQVTKLFSDRFVEEGSDNIDKEYSF